MEFNFIQSGPTQKNRIRQLLVPINTVNKWCNHKRKLVSSKRKILMNKRIVKSFVAMSLRSGKEKWQLDNYHYLISYSDEEQSKEMKLHYNY